MSSDYYGGIAGELADNGFTPCGAEEDWPDLAPAGVAICTRESGHGGEHRDDTAGVWWRSPVPGCGHRPDCGCPPGRCQAEEQYENEMAAQ